MCDLLLPMIFQYKEHFVFIFSPFFPTLSLNAWWNIFNSFDSTVDNEILFLPEIFPSIISNYVLYKILNAIGCIINKKAEVMIGNLLNWKKLLCTCQLFGNLEWWSILREALVKWPICLTVTLNPTRQNCCLTHI